MPSKSPVQKLIVEVDDITKVFLDGIHQGIKRFVKAVLVVFIQGQGKNFRCTITADHGRCTDEVSGLAVFTVLIRGNRQNATLVVEHGGNHSFKSQTDAIEWLFSGQ